MKVKILRGFCLGGGIDVAPGDIVEIDDKRAPVLIQQGRIVPVGEVAAEAETPKPARKGAKNA
jgi:hypothetical protein